MPLVDTRNLGLSEGQLLPAQFAVRTGCLRRLVQQLFLHHVNPRRRPKEREGRGRAFETNLEPTNTKPIAALDHSEITAIARAFWGGKLESGMWWRGLVAIFIKLHCTIGESFDTFGCVFVFARESSNLVCMVCFFSVACQGHKYKSKLCDCLFWVS